ncbi:uncharacterized protein RDI95_001112 [Morus bassanus]
MDHICEEVTSVGRDVSTEKHWTIMTIGINRPEASNAVNQETAALFLLTFNTLTFPRCFIGGNFCAVYDLKGLAHNPTSIKLEQHVTKGPGPMIVADAR